MLFDLRGRGRRRTVQAVYLGLALLMGGGLILFGVGAGNGFGGILNAFTGQGSSGAQKQVISQQEKTALRETRLQPGNPQGWADLVRARWTTAGQAPNYDSNTQTFTADGKKELNSTVQAWERYTQLTKTVDPSLAIIAARAYAALANYAGEASAWEAETLASPTEPKGFECLAISAYAAGQTRKGDLASAKAIGMLPKASQTTTQQTMQAAKASQTTAKQIAQQC